MKRSILFLIPILITSCGGQVTMDATDGSKIQFKRENVTCEKDDYYYTSYKGTQVKDLKCTAYGVRTLLNGDKVNFSESKVCVVMNKKGKEFDNFKWDWNGENRNSFACGAAKKFGKSK